jgi:dihydropteroate synthase
MAWGHERLTALEARGIERERMILDPGIGFGKTPEQNAELLRRAGELSAMGTRILVGHSRKSFLAGWYPPGNPGATDPAARDHETALLSGHLARLGVDYLRVHDVAATVRALRAGAFVGSP